MIGKNHMKIDMELLKKERKQWRENSLLQTKSILRLSQELDNLRKQKEILHEKLLKSATQDQMKKSAEQYEYFREQQHKKWLDKIAYNKAIEIVEKKIKHKKNYNQPINFIKHEDK